MNRVLPVFLAHIGCPPLLAAQANYAKRIAPPIDPARLATLGMRGLAYLPSRQIESHLYGPT